MTKPATKRKSEGALPTTRTKQQRVTIAQENANYSEESEEAEDASGEELFVAPQPLTKRAKKLAPERKSEPVAMIEKTAEYEEDVGRLESQSFINLVARQNSRKKRAASEVKEFLENFRERLQRDENKLKSRAGKKNSEALQSTTNFLATFKAIYKAASPVQGGTREADNTEKDRLPDFAAMYPRGQKLVNNCLQVVDNFNEMREKVSAANFPKFNQETQKQELEDHVKLFEIGRAVGTQKHESILTALKQPVLDSDHAHVADIFYKPTQEQDATDSWGKTARKQIKVVKKLGKTFLIVDPWCGRDRER